VEEKLDDSKMDHDPALGVQERNKISDDLSSHQFEEPLMPRQLR
jgi:hypothetical protein